METAEYPLFCFAVPPTRHGTLCSHWSDMMSVCFRSPWLGKLVLWNAVKMPVWTHHQTRHHCRQCRHAASGSTEIRSPGKKSTNAHVGIFAGLCNWRGEEKEGRAPRGYTHLQFGLLRVAVANFLREDFFKVSFVVDSQKLSILHSSVATLSLKRDGDKVKKNQD